MRARAALAAGRFMVSDLAPCAHGTLREHGQRRSFSHAGGQTQRTCACLTDPSNVCGRTCERTHLQEACRLQTHFRGTVAATWCRTQLTPSLRARVGARTRTMTTAAVTRFRATSELPALPAQSAGATCRPERLLQSPMRGPRLPRVASWPRLLRVASCPAILPLGRRRSSGSGGCFARAAL